MDRTAEDRALAALRQMIVDACEPGIPGGIGGLARNADAASVMARTLSMVEALRLRLGFGPGRLARSAASHSALLRAPRARDATKAASLLEASSQNAMADLLARAIAVGGCDETGAVSGHAGQRRRSR